jgi:hypothetical protein
MALVDKYDIIINNKVENLDNEIIHNYFDNLIMNNKFTVLPNIINNFIVFKPETSKEIINKNITKKLKEFRNGIRIKAKTDENIINIIQSNINKYFNIINKINIFDNNFNNFNNLIFTYLIDDPEIFKAIKKVFLEISVDKKIIKNFYYQLFKLDPEYILSKFNYKIKNAIVEKIDDYNFDNFPSEKYKDIYITKKIIDFYQFYSDIYEFIPEVTHFLLYKYSLFIKNKLIDYQDSNFVHYCCLVTPILKNIINYIDEETFFTFEEIFNQNLLNKINNLNLQDLYTMYKLLQNIKFSDNFPIQYTYKLFTDKINNNEKEFARILLNNITDNNLWKIYKSILNKDIVKINIKQNIQIDLLTGNNEITKKYKSLPFTIKNYNNDIYKSKIFSDKYNLQIKIITPGLWVLPALTQPSIVKQNNNSVENYLVDIQNKYQQEEKNKDLLWYLHCGSIDINYETNKGKVFLTLLPIQALILGNFEKQDSIKINEINQYNYDKNEINHIFATFLENEILIKTENTIYMNYEISGNYNLINSFFERSNLIENLDEFTKKELAHERYHVIASIINHFLKQSNMTKEELLSKTKENCDVFDVTTELFNNTFDKMIEKEYIEISGRSY